VIFNPKPDEQFSLEGQGPTGYELAAAGRELSPICMNNYPGLFHCI